VSRTDDAGQPAGNEACGPTSSIIRSPSRLGDPANVSQLPAPEWSQPDFPALNEAEIRADEAERARLIANIACLIREPAMPEATRLAGLTLIGWLARRRPEEPPHAIGVKEARKSERRLQAVRSKAR
jgi:hypothetical protein